MDENKEINKETNTDSTITSPQPSTEQPQQPVKITPDSKIVVYFKNAGGAQALKQKKFKLQANLSFQNVIDKLRSQLKLKSNESLFLFINQVFQPSPDEILGELYKCFCHNDQLIINYSDLPAWG
ncbi:hypothetical protein DICPUDRAFT_74321 [Dictyostelium purpureum]|uniref:Ubiquitin-like protein ATG12 n=1 Tax=Dictyostelium purpureum TaxID=5786 RepID=F0Z7E1_DICPU|nr:uncharacterized protein DICPUDRAFT_74321 [Dictyostelium purpureum]EGC40161.1 hypothetical protein DICPUDRAFT_74321 [Dictyostelium purpureum]|eukprot:XP_003283351.1 hypothetical protein DICPUDRAFT_74321 [Dictyostelium purpureum]